MPNLYEMLEVSERATASEIKKAYYQQAKKYHPDKNKYQDTTEHMQSIANAHDILSDSEKRQQYDEGLHKKIGVDTTMGANKEPHSVMNIDEFWLELIYLSPEMRTLVFEAVKNDLPNMIKSITDFNKALQFIDDQQRMLVFEMMKNQLPNMFRGYPDFLNTFKYLKIEAIKNSLPILLTWSRDFRQLMEYSTPEERIHVFEAMKSKLPTLYKDIDDLSDIFKFLDSKQRQDAFEILKNNIAESTKRWDSLFETFEYLNLEHCQVLLVMVKERLFEKLEYVSDLKHEIRELNPQLLEMVLTTVKSTLITFVKNKYKPDVFCQLSDILKLLGDERRISFLQDIIDGLSWLQVDKKELNELLKYSFEMPEERLMLLEAMQATLMQIIPINTLDTFVTTYFSDNIHQQKAKQLYFTSLLHEFKNKLNLNDITENEDKIVLQVLHDSLKNASQLYFNQQPSQANYGIFQMSCDKALSIARKELNNPDEWKNTLAIKSLTIISLGTLPIANQLHFGNSRLNFFKTENERKIDDIAGQIDKFKPHVANY